MEMRGTIKSGSKVAVLCVLAAVPVVSLAASDIAAFGMLERGRWTLSSADGAAPKGSYCLGDPSQLIQLAHQGAQCAHEVLANSGPSVTVNYTCAGHGFGHTDLRVETPRAATIDTQGLIDGRPFSYRVSARKTGAC
jgi:hypothetical protein